MIANEMVRSEAARTSRPWVPLLALMAFSIWLIALGFVLWPRTKTDEVPVYDAIGYAQKAKIFWAEMAKGKLFNPLNSTPAFRPPGTILLSYPAGFDGNIRAFFYRSILIPAIIFGWAVFIAVWASRRDRDRWPAAALSGAIATTIPAFYQFSYGKGLLNGYWGSMDTFIGHWGLVDTFIGSVTALSVSLTIAGMFLGTRWLGALALFAAAFTIYIKPVGSIMYPLCAGMYFASRVLICIREKQPWKALYIDLGMIAGFGLLLLPARFSDYLSNEMIGFGKSVMAMMRAALDSPVTLPWALKIVWRVVSIIPGLMLMGFGAVAAVGVCRKKQIESNSTFLLVSGIVWVTTGIGFVFLVSGLVHVRYGLPFFFSAMVCMIVVIVDALFCMHQSVRYAALALVGMQLAAFMLLLAGGKQTSWINSLGGWNMSISPYGEEVCDARRWIGEISSRRWTHYPVVYIVSSGQQSDFVASLFLYDKMVDDAAAKGRVCIATIQPQNFLRKTGYFTEELRKADFVLGGKVKRQTPPPKNAGVMAKQLYFSWLLQSATERDSGCVPRRIGSTMVIYDIGDRAQFMKFLNDRFGLWIDGEKAD